MRNIILVMAWTGEHMRQGFFPCKGCRGMERVGKENKYVNYGLVKNDQYFVCNGSGQENRTEYTQQIFFCIFIYKLKINYLNIEEKLLN